jgi:hypothetical protein
VGYCESVGAWRSLVARTVRVGEVPSSNLGAPIKKPRKCGVFVGLKGSQGQSLGSEWAVRVVHCQNTRSGSGEIGMVAWLSTPGAPRKLR